MLSKRTDIPAQSMQPLASYDFTPTQDWFSHNIKAWTSFFPFIKSPNPRALEIGSWEGRSAVFILTTLCKGGGEITCIDHFDLLRTSAGRERFAKIQHNLALTGRPFRIMPEFSFPALMKLLVEEMASDDPGFDWIYIDGSHEADDTMLDGELAWRLARKGAVIVFDDYCWDKEPCDSVHHPRRGIDAFLALHTGDYERLSSTEGTDYQVVLQKLTPMRIGFLALEIGLKDDADLGHVFKYGINIALAIDSSFAMPAAVTIRSAIENTTGRITFYVIDCGLSEADKKQLSLSLPGDEGGEPERVTLMFITGKESLAAAMGPTWARLELHDLLPVERVLYLDADTLVRSSLKEIWETDIRAAGKSIAAVVDVGHPMGHGEFCRTPYFNAGVLLMDLAKIRQRGNELRELGRKMKSSRYGDQDALNVHFKDDWYALPLRWNAQGLGTYAKYPTPERELLDIKTMEDASISHFTGPVDPKLVDVLNPHVQPPTAKPWGYMSAPGHPFEHEWWEVLEKTAWQGIRSSEAEEMRRRKVKQELIDEAIEEFKKRVDFGLHLAGVSHS